MPSELLAGPSLDSYWSESVNLTCSLRSMGTLGRLALSALNLGSGGYGTALALGHRWRPEARCIFFFQIFSPSLSSLLVLSLNSLMKLWLLFFSTLCPEIYIRNSPCKYFRNWYVL